MSGASILVTGAAGQLGAELVHALAPYGTVTGADRAALDLSDPAAIVAAVRASRPALIVNAGAYTAVDRAETEVALADAVNAVAPGVLAEEAKRLGAVLIHYSTDYVFDGEARDPWTEDDPVRPVSAYGRSKLAGERAVEASGADAIVLRTSWVYARRGRNFLLTMQRLADEGRASRGGRPVRRPELEPRTRARDREDRRGGPARARRAPRPLSPLRARAHDMVRVREGDLRGPVVGARHADHDRGVSDRRAAPGDERPRHHTVRTHVRFRAAGMAGVAPRVPDRSRSAGQRVCRPLTGAERCGIGQRIPHNPTNPGESIDESSN